jgi:AcrR family transcriptional regulator
MRHRDADAEHDIMPRLMDATRAARRDHILRAAQTCFARRGYHATTMEDIAAEAGIAKGAPYVHFAGKEAIFLALYDEWGCALRAEIEEALEALPSGNRASAQQVLRVVLQVTGRHVQVNARACRVLMEGRHLAAFVPAIAERVGREQVEGQQRIEALIRTGVEAGEWPAAMDIPARATLLRATMHGLMATWHAAPGAFEWEALAELLVDW